jgi:xylulokinase
MFLPYLAGERTPHNDPDATGAFIKLTHRAARGELAYAVMEGVALALADGYAGFGSPRSAARPLWAVGGGTRSILWLRLIADGIGRPLIQPEATSEFGPAFGAARLARLAATGEAASSTCAVGGGGSTIAVDPDNANRLAARLQRFRRLYELLATLNR